MTSEPSAYPSGGALAGLRIIEFLGIGPGPFAGMMLADHGAEVIRVMRPDHQETFPDFDRFDVLARSRKVVAIDLKSPDGVRAARDLIGSADGLIEGFRPGVMERIGLGPAELIAQYPSLVYGRITGWGQDGPLAQTAGHDINYISINGLLHTVGRPGERPTPPVNYLADFGGGGMLLAFGMTAALLAVARGGPGQVVDAAMIDGSALLSGMVWQMKAAGRWSGPAGANLLDGGAHFYDTFECADGRFVAIGAIEPQFYARLLKGLGLADDTELDAQMDEAAWPRLRQKIAVAIATRSRDEWAALFSNDDACLTPVLTLDEARHHPHVTARNTYIEVGGQTQPAPAPRFSVTAPFAPRPPGLPSQEIRSTSAIYSVAQIAARDDDVVK